MPAVAGADAVIRTHRREQGRPLLTLFGEVTVTRTGYDAQGNVLFDETWNTSYRGEFRFIRVGTKPKPKPKKAAIGPDGGPAPVPAKATPDGAVATSQP